MNRLRGSPTWKPEHRLSADRSGLVYPSGTGAEWAIIESLVPPLIPACRDIDFFATCSDTTELIEAIDSLFDEVAPLVTRDHIRWMFFGSIAAGSRASMPCLPRRRGASRGVHREAI
jgi:hypothetical protein